MVIARKDNELQFLQAAKKGDIEGVKFGLSQNINVNIRSEVGNSALWLAAFFSYLELCEYLLQKGADPLLSDSEGCTPFANAYYSENKEILELFEKFVGEKYDSDKHWGFKY